MGQRRMFSQQIVGSDTFLEMPTSTRELYFHLGMYADDDGFINPKKIMRMVGAQDDDLKVLLSKRFLLPFENGVVVIKHWLIHNTIRLDRYKETHYLDEKRTLLVKENKAYTELATSGLPNGNQMATQVKLSKDKLSQVKLIKDATPSVASKETQEIINLFKGVNPSYERLFPNKTQRSAVERLIKKFGFEKIKNTVEALPDIINKKYAPRITTPVQLEENLGKLIAFVNQDKEKSGGKIIRFTR